MNDKFQDIISKIESMTVLELSELVKALEEKFGVSAAALAAPVAAEASAGKEEKTSFDVILKAAGDQKINVIKLVKEISGLGLQESKALVEGAPKPVKTGLKKEEAEELVKKLQEMGATAEIQ